MFRRINGNVYKTTNAQCVAKADIKRGLLVTIDSKETGREVTPAATTADVRGIAVRGEMVDDRVAMGLKADIYADTQDLVKAGQLVGVEPLLVGDVYATTEFAATVTAEKAYGKLKVVAGKLDVAAEGDVPFAEGEGLIQEIGAKVKMLKFRVL